MMKTLLIRPETSTNVRSIKEYAKSDAEYGAHQDIAMSIHFLVKLRLLSCRFHG